jgi:hypothetical protein
MPKDDTVTYLIELDDDTLKKITVPADWTVTFGALIPGQQSNGGRLGMRFWKGKQQKALFQNVKSFRDLSIKLEERVTTRKEETYYKGDEDNRKAVVVEGKVHEWINPDEPRPQPEKKDLQQLRVVNLD